MWNREIITNSAGKVFSCKAEKGACLFVLSDKRHALFILILSQQTV